MKLMNKNIKIAVVMTCFNRVESTMQCLFHLSLNDGTITDGTELFILDDGSNDGTAKEIIRQYPCVNLINGDGSNYWCGGMRKAWRLASESDPEYYLLLNDDTMVNNTCISEMLTICTRSDNETIAVGATCDPESGKASYGCWKSRKGLISPTGRPEEGDTFNCNAVLVPRVVFQKLGIFHDAYTHGMGDFDYGYQARKAGIKILMTPNFIGTCKPNSIEGTWRDRNLTRKQRLQKLMSPKGLPISEWATFCRRNTDLAWPWRTITPYIRVMLGF